MKATSYKLTGPAFVVLSGWQLVGVLGILDPVFLAAYAGGLPLLAGVFLWDLRSVRAVQGPRFVVGRIPEVELDRTQEVPARLALRFGARRPSSVEVRCRSLSIAGVSPERFQLRGLRDNPASADFRLTLTGKKLGKEDLGPPQTRMISGLRLWLRLLEPTVAKATVRVIPSLAKVSEHALSQVQQQQRSLFVGSKQVLRDRSPDQFYTVRKYQFPDSIRHVDHKKSARYGKLMTRVYDSLHNHHLVVGLDLGRSMAGTVAGSGKIDFYLNAAGQLISHALQERDRVSFFGFAQTVPVMIKASHSAGSFHLLRDGDPRLAVQPVESNYLLINQVLSALGRQRSLFVLLTDTNRPSVQQALLDSLGPVCRKHRTIVLSLTDKRYNLDLKIQDPSASRVDESTYPSLLTSYWLASEYEMFRQKLSRMGGGSVTVAEEQWVDMTLKVYDMMRLSLYA